jgi:hypothetical protein
LEEIRDANGGFEGIGGVGIAEIVGEEAVADQAGNTAEKNAGGNEKSGTGGAKTPRCGGRRAGCGIGCVLRSRSVQGVFYALGLDSKRS